MEVKAYIESNSFRFPAFCFATERNEVNAYALKQSPKIITIYCALILFVCLCVGRKGGTERGRVLFSYVRNTNMKDIPYLIKAKQFAKN